MKSCKDCKFSAPDNSLTFILSDLFGFNYRWEFANCKHPVSKKSIEESRHLRLEEVRITYTSCNNARRDYGGATVCGSEARLFEPHA